MQNANRIKNTVKLPRGVRLDTLRRIDDQLRTGTEPPLLQDEIRELGVALCNEREPLISETLWRIALQSTASESILEHAERALAESNVCNREYAFMYMTTLRPDRKTAMISHYRDDPDPEVRYQVAQLVRETDLVKGIDMMLNIYPEAKSHSLHDALCLEIIENGTQVHLNELRKRMQDPKLWKVYHDVASALEDRLKK